jgi:site-specific recombinase XerD
MLEFYFQDPDTIQRIRKGPVGPYIDSFADELKRAGYSWQSAQQHVLFAEAFGAWLKFSRAEVSRVTVHHIDKYVCYRERHQQRTKGAGLLTALRRIVKIIREADVDGDDSVQDARTPVERMVDEFDHYLLQDRGLVAVTMQCYSQFVKKFLMSRFKTGPVELKELNPKDVLNFVQVSAHSQSVKRLKLLVTSLRSFFQFAKYRGYIVLDLGACVPTVADWSKTEIPRALPMEKNQEHIIAV